MSGVALRTRWDLVVGSSFNAKGGGFFATARLKTNIIADGIYRANGRAKFRLTKSPAHVR